MSSVSLAVGAPVKAKPSTPTPSSSSQSATFAPVQQKSVQTPSAHELEQAFQRVQERNLELEKDWHQFMDSLLDLDEVVLSNAPSQDKSQAAEPGNVTEKSVATTVFHHLKALASNLKLGVQLAEQAKTQHRMTRFEYQLPNDQTTRTFEFTSIPTGKQVCQYFTERVQDIEKHAPGSDEFVKAVQSFMNDSRN